jgi:hypothetical protein
VWETPFVSGNERKAPGERESECDSRVPLPNGVVVAIGTTRESESGVYSVDWDGERSRHKVEGLLTGFRKEGIVVQAWKHGGGICADFWTGNSIDQRVTVGLALRKGQPKLDYKI